MNRKNVNLEYLELLSDCWTCPKCGKCTTCDRTYHKYDLAKYMDYDNIVAMESNLSKIEKENFYA